MGRISTDVPVSQSGGFRGLPFNGPLGDGRHGSATLTTQTLTELIAQYNDLTINVGQTVTAKAINPGGVIWAVRGTLTLAGTLEASNVGAPLQGAAASDVGGTPGRGFAGGSGGAGVGFNGGDCMISLPGLIAEGLAGTGAPTRAHIWQIFETLKAPVSGAGIAASALVAGYFDYLWAHDPLNLLGYGAAGAQDSAPTAGIGGKGGGCVFILCNVLNFTGTINAKGQAAGGTTAGGGGGGQVIIGYRTLTANTGTITVTGGAGAGVGGAGAAGYSKVFDMRM